MRKQLYSLLFFVTCFCCLSCQPTFLGRIGSFLGFKTSIHVAVLAFVGDVSDAVFWSEQLRKACENDAFDAILLRVDSLGGNVGSGKILYDEVVKAVARKPVVAIVENTCCSAAYYLACPCYIVAGAGARIGAIGVYHQHERYIPKHFKEGKLSGDVEVEFFFAGKNKLAGNVYGPKLTEEQRLWMQEYVNTLYKDFCDDVKRVRPLVSDDSCQGDVFMAGDALELGLIDEIGSYTEALEVIKKRVGIQGPIDIFSV